MWTAHALRSRTQRSNFARPAAVHGMAPQTAERVRGHTLAAVALVRHTVGLSETKEPIGVHRSRIARRAFQGHARQAGRLRLSAPRRNPTAWTLCSP